MKKALVVVAGIIFILGIGILVYTLFFAPSARLTVGTTDNSFTAANSSTETQTTALAQPAATGAGTVIAPNLIKITSAPVAAGTISFDINPVYSTTTQNTSSPGSPASSTVTTTNSRLITPGDQEVRFIDRASGNIYAYRAVQRSLARISNKTLPGIQEASWVANGSMALVRYLDHTGGSENVTTYALPADGSNGYFLESNLAQAVVVGSSTVFTLAVGPDSSTGSTARIDGTSPQTLFTSPLTTILARVAGKTFMAVTKAAAEMDGFAFTASGSSFSPILGPLRGLTILPSPSGTLVLFSHTQDGSTLTMSVLDTVTGTATALPLATIADKCVWTPDSSAVYCGIPVTLSGTLPDDWYQGVISFTDRIWRIDLTTRLATLIVDPSQEGKVAIDAVNLSIDPNGRVLVFRNKKDSSLWAYSL